MLGGELFRSKVTSYRISTFEDLVIFVIDFNACFSRLGEAAQRFIALHAFQEHTKEEAAARMGCDVRNARRIYCDALDELTEILLRFEMISDRLDRFRGRGGRMVRRLPCDERRNAWSARELPPKKPSRSAQGATVPKAMHAISKR